MYFFNFHILSEHIIKIDIDTLGRNDSELVYLRQLEVPSRAYSTFIVSGLDQSFMSHAVFQLHAFQYNVSLSLERNMSTNNHQQGMNLGFVIEAGPTTKSIFMFNDNYDDVQVLVALIVYNNSAPVIGGCSMELMENNPATLTIEESERFIIIYTQMARPSVNTMTKGKSSFCADNVTTPLLYSTYYMYLDQLNFESDIYFDAIKKMIFRTVTKNSHQVGFISKEMQDHFWDFPFLNKTF